MRTLAGPALIAVALLVSGCGSDGIPLREEPQLLARAQQVIRDGGGPVLFRELAGGDWDRVQVFPGPPRCNSSSPTSAWGSRCPAVTRPTRTAA